METTDVTASGPPSGLENINDEERGKLARLGSELRRSLAVREKLLGFISLGPKRSEETYTSSDLRLLKSVAVQTGLEVRSAGVCLARAEGASWWRKQRGPV